MPPVQIPIDAAMDSSNPPAQDAFEANDAEPGTVKGLLQSYSNRRTTCVWFMYILQLLLGLGLIGIAAFIANAPLDTSFIARKYDFSTHLTSTHAFDTQTEVLRALTYLLYATGFLFVCRRTLDLVPLVLNTFLSTTGIVLAPRFKNEIVHFYNLRRHLAWLAALALLTVVGDNIYHEFTDEQSRLLDKSAFFFVNRATVISAIVMAIVCLHKWIMQRISISFHQVHYADRLQESHRSMNVINGLKKYVQKMSSMQTREALKSGAIGKALLGLAPKLDTDHQFGVEGHDGDEEVSNEELQTEATTLAREIFGILKPGQNIEKASLVPEDFIAVFGQKEYEDAFDMLDLDGNKDLTLSELCRAIVDVYRQHRDLLRALYENSHIVAKLGNMIAFGLGIFGLQFVLNMLEISTAALATLATTFLGFTWLCNGLIQEIFNALIFMFILHPYDVGDRVFLGDDKGTILMVTETNLLTTEFHRADGQIVYYNNSDLRGKAINNCRRSEAQSQSYSLSLPAATPLDKVEELRKAIMQALAAYPRDFTVDPRTFFRYQIKGAGELDVTFDVQHKSNFQDIALMYKRQQLFGAEYAKLLQKLGLSK